MLCGVVWCAWDWRGWILGERGGGRGNGEGGRGEGNVLLNNNAITKNPMLASAKCIKYRYRSHDSVSSLHPAAPSPSFFPPPLAYRSGTIPDSPPKFSMRYSTMNPDSASIKGFLSGFEISSMLTIGDFPSGWMDFSSGGANCDCRLYVLRE